ncbi:MAG: dodecin family protein, partial [Candidatus Thiodiazotropha sp. (ex Gloverina cf. vestifex)]|nr:dodecin family protein [Candidatus Thiodiazotropha sp. (ex Gloverina cf. vestifex)]
MSDHVYKKIQLVGSSNTSTDDAIRNAIARAGETIENMNWQACRYLVKDFGTSESPKSTRQRDSRYAPT